MKIFFKFFLLSTISVFVNGDVYASKSLDKKFMNSFNNYKTYEKVIEPQNQFYNLLGIKGYADQRLKKSSFKLRNIYKIESSKQIGKYRLNGSDINNTFNESLQDF
ncbi:hypothetical protein CU313_05615 [Prochlorococcus marinus str. MU1404]|uniref:hypothetical protein n=1 Tax=Prochlorococcus marinus TaxID=1219 RepID=UPI001ADAC78F|nr:hypothetical protein [Prochlorococcus marinus]MBO8229870.1 hypothetical protein [Prochlorococcus marinus XMU1404]MBW3073345.1 hypothetical protein [Prochlorococcus marinus str. MU1404]MCR8545794.1 hypothetical protein [Prochlorococcus marinus CUG1432]